VGAWGIVSRWYLDGGGGFYRLLRWQGGGLNARWFGGEGIGF